MRFSEALAPLYAGRVRLPGPNGLVWEVAAQGPPGWSWWAARPLWLRPADPGDLRALPLRTLQLVETGVVEWQGRRLPLRFGETLAVRQRVRAWLENGLAWYVELAPGLPPRPPAGVGERLERAIRLGGGLLHGWSQAPHGLDVVWSRHGVRVTSRVRPDLGVLQAGFCLSDTDRVHDLTSLVSLRSREV